MGRSPEPAGVIELSFSREEATHKHEKGGEEEDEVMDGREGAKGHRGLSSAQEEGEQKRVEEVGYDGTDEKEVGRGKG